MAQPDLSQRDWMGKAMPFLLDKCLSEIALPGAHDAATASMHPGCKFFAPFDKLPRALSQTVCRWSRAQGLSVYGTCTRNQYSQFIEQLERGIRYLDIRLAWDAATSVAVAVHGMYGETLPAILAAIARFVNENQFEIVVVDINHLYDFNSVAHHAALSCIFENLGDKLLQRTPCQCPAISTGVSGLCRTLGSIWESNERVMVCYATAHVANGCSYLWPPQAISSPWPDTTSLHELRIKLDFTAGISHGAFDKSRTPQKHQLKVLQGVLTPDLKMVLHGEIARPNSVEDLSHGVTPHVTNWLATRWANIPVNIVIVDWFDQCNFADTVIAKNRPVPEPKIMESV